MVQFAPQPPVFSRLATVYTRVRTIGVAALAVAACRNEAPTWGSRTRSSGERAGGGAHLSSVG